MLLSYIRDILDGDVQHINRTVDVYKVIVEKWLEREHTFDNTIDPDRLHAFSKKLAVDFHMQSAYEIHYDQLEPLARNWGFNFSQQKLTSRSLLNRDGLGNYKFAHRSIMEYLFVDSLVEGLEGLGSAELTDQMYWFLLEFLGLKPGKHMIKEDLDMIRSLNTASCSGRHRTFL